MCAGDSVLGIRIVNDQRETIRLRSDLQLFAAAMDPTVSELKDGALLFFTLPGRC